MTQAPCLTRFLEDHPADQDALTKDDVPGPHERVATTLATMIRHDPGGKMIGIQGAWGSGKSTVVSLVKKKLEEEAKQEEEEIEVFSFDVWAHEGDPLRRTFLESLAGALFTREWVKTTDKNESSRTWQEILDELSGHRRVEEVESSSGLTFEGKATGLAALLTPLGAALLSGPAGEGLVLASKSSIDWQATSGFTLLLAPFAILLTAACFKGRRLRLLSAETTKTTKSVVSRTVDPTSIEFENYFRRLIEQALTAQMGRRLVIVVDNLDRVEPDDAKKVWSTLQVFLGDAKVRMEGWFQRVWFVVPYDPSGLTALWGGTGAAPGKRGVEPSETTASEDQAAARNQVRESFLDKSFQFRFEVPPLALSDWRDRLQDLIREALPSHGNDAHRIYRVVSHCLKQSGQTPTLRHLKNIVNQIGVIHRQWEDTYDLGDVAYYVMLRRDRLAVIKELLKGTLPEPGTGPLVTGGCRETLTALAYNLPAQQATQLLLAGPIRKALSENDAKELGKLCEVHGEGFWAVLGDRVELDALTANELGNTALCLQSALSQHQQRPAYTSLVECLTRTVRATSEWRPLSPELAKGIVAICETTDIDAVWAGIIDNVSVHLHDRGLGSVDKEAPDAVAFLTHLLSAVPERLQGIEFDLDIPAADWRALCPLLEATDPKGIVTQRLRPLCAEAFRTELSQKIREGAKELDLPLLVEVSLRSAGDFGFHELLRPIESRFTVQTRRNYSETPVLLKALFAMKRHGLSHVEQVLTTLAGQPGCAHWIGQEWGQQETRDYGTVLLLLHRPALEEFTGNPNHTGRSQNGLEQVRQELKQDDPQRAERLFLILKSVNALSILPSSPQLEPSPLLQHVLALAAEQCPTAIEPHELFTHWQTLRKVLIQSSREESWERFCIAHRDEWAQRLEADGFSGELLPLAHDLLTDGELRDLERWCIDGLLLADQKFWQWALVGRNEATGLLDLLIDRGHKPHLGVALKDALVWAARGMAGGRTYPKLKGRFDVLRSLLPVESQELLDEDIVLHLSRSIASLNQDGWDTLGAVFARFAEKQPDRALAELMEPLLAAGSEAGLAWLRNFAEEHPHYLKGQKRAGEVQEHVALAMKDKESEDLKAIAERWGIKSPTLKKS